MFTQWVYISIAFYTVIAKETSFAMPASDGSLMKLHGVGGRKDASQSFTTAIRNLIGTNEEAIETTTVRTELQGVAVLHAKFRLGPIESTTSRRILNMIYILWIGQSHKSRNASVPYPQYTTWEQKRAHFCANVVFYVIWDRCTRGYNIVISWQY